MDLFNSNNVMKRRMNKYFILSKEQSQK